MKACDDIDLDALVFGGFSPESAARARAHLGACERCKREYEALRRERGLFAARRQLAADDVSLRNALPDFDAILHSANQPAGLFARLAAALFDAPRVWRGAMERIAIVTAVAVVLVGVVRQHARSGAPSDAVAMRSLVSASAASKEGAAPGASAPCAPEETVCRKTFGLTPETSFATSPSITADRFSLEPARECDTERSSSSSMPSAFDRIVSSSTMCTPNEI